MTGYSSVIPFAPSRSRLKRAHSKSHGHVIAFEHRYLRGPQSAAVFQPPACNASNCALVISVIIHASFSWTS